MTSPGEEHLVKNLTHLLLVVLVFHLLRQRKPVTHTGLQGLRKEGSASEEPSTRWLH